MQHRLYDKESPLTVLTVVEWRHMIDTRNDIHRQMHTQFPQFARPATMVIWLTPIINHHRDQHGLSPVSQAAVAMLEETATGADYRDKLALYAAQLACGVQDAPVPPPWWRAGPAAAGHDV